VRLRKTTQFPDPGDGLAVAVRLRSGPVPVTEASDEMLLDPVATGMTKSALGWHVLGVTNADTGDGWAFRECP
jgi:hypothetical protein